MNLNYIKNSHDFKLDDDDIIIEKNFDHKDTHFDIYEWKQDIEKSLEKISERVASNNSNPLINILEKRLNDFYNELIKLKKQFYEDLENNSKSNEKIEKTEKSLNTVQSQFSEFKTNMNKWQSDVGYKFKILNEKIEIEENSSDLFKEFIKASNVKFENFSATIKNIINENKLNKDYFDNKYFERLKQLEDMDKNLVSQITSLNKMINQEFKKYEGNLFNTIMLLFMIVSNKALWDSLALLTSSIKGESV
jgi:hypothetical protein